MPSTIWPMIPFVALRGAQLFFAIVVLGLSAHIGSSLTAYYSYYGYSNSVWSAWFSMVSALFTLIGVGFLLVAFFILPNFAAPVFALAIDVFLFIFWLISLAGFANQFQLILGNSYYNDEASGEIKGDMAMIVFEFLLFIGTIVFSALWLHKERSGKLAAGHPEAGHASSGAIGGAPAVHGNYPMQQQQPHPTGTPAPGPQYEYAQAGQPYPQQPVPPQPAGYQQPAHTGPTSYAPTA